MRSGRLRHRVTLQRATTTQGAFGQPVISWSDLGTYWAEVKPMGSREQAYAQQVHAHASHRVLMRGNFTLTSADRLQYDGKTLGILDARQTDVGGRTPEWVLICREDS